MSKKVLRICVVSPLYHPSLGGPGRQAQLLTERLVEEGLELFIIARRMKNIPEARFSPKIKVYRAWSIKPKVHTFEEVRFINIFISLTFSISCALLLLWKKKSYDLVHFHGASLPLFFNLPLLKLLRKRVIAKVAAAKVGTEAGSLRGRYIGLGNMIIWLLKMVDTFVATTAEIEEGLQRDGFPVTKINRIPNFIDLSLFAPASADIRKKIKAKMGFEDNLIVTFSGRFIQRKGIDSLLKAWKDIVSEHSNVRLILLGDGPLLKDMRRMAARLEITSSVEFYGHVHQITDILNTTDIFVLPSLQEGMPNSLMEAMACGLAIVATRIGGVIDIVKDKENGILVEPGDSKDMAAGIQRLLEDKEFARHIALNAFKTIMDFYTLDSIVPLYIALYKSNLPKHGM